VEILYLLKKLHPMKRAASYTEELELRHLFPLAGVIYRIQSYLPTVSLIHFTRTCNFFYERKGLLLGMKEEETYAQSLNRMRQYLQNCHLLPLAESFLAESNGLIFGDTVVDFITDKKPKCVPSISIPKSIYNMDCVMEILTKNLDMVQLRPVIVENCVAIIHESDLEDLTEFYNYHTAYLHRSPAKKALLFFRFHQIDNFVHRVKNEYEALGRISSWTDLKTIRCSNLIPLLVKNQI